MTIIYETNEPQAQHLATLLGDGTVVTTPEGLVERINADADEMLVLLGPSTEVSDAVGFAEQCRLRRPALGVVLLREFVDIEVMADALRGGLREVVHVADHAAVLAACARSRDLSRQLLAASRPTGRAKVPEAAVPMGPIDGDVITVFSAKGGAGKSTIATNLAVIMAQGGKKRVCLMDLNLAFGDIAILLQLAPDRTIADAIPVADRIDDTGLRSLLVPYKPGVDVLLAPVQPALAEEVNRSLVTDLIQLARENFDYVIVDSASAFNEQMLAALDATHHYVLVATPELPSLKNLRVTLDMFELLDYRREARSVVLNRADSKVGLTMSEIERIIRVPISAFIPSSRDVPISANKGVPLAISHPSHPVSMAIKDLAVKRFIPAEAQAKRGLFSRGKNS